MIDSALAIAAVVLAAFWIGWALDYLPVRMGGTEMPTAARAMYLVAALAIVVFLVIKFLIARLSRPLPDDSLALLVERQHPDLGGRLVTAVQLVGQPRDGDWHAPALLDQVHQQAVEQMDQVDPSRVLRAEPLVRKASIVIPLALLALAFVILSPGNFARAASRLTLLSDTPWPRKAKLSMVGVELPILAIGDEEPAGYELVEFEDHTIRLPRGSSGTLRITARADDQSEVPTTCTVYFRTDSGTRGQANMRRIGRVRDQQQAFVLDGPPLAALDDSMTFSVHGLDDRLADFRIEAVAPPAIVQSDVEVRYPDYLRTSNEAVDVNASIDRRDQYESGLRVREGSDVTMVARAGSPMGHVDAYVSTAGGDFVRVPASIDSDGFTARVQLDDLSEPTSVQLVPQDPDGISAQAPYRYFLGVVRDEPPELSVRLKGIGSAVTSRAKIPMTVIAKDDHGLADMTITTSVETPEAPAASEASDEPDSSGDAGPANEGQKRADTAPQVPTIVDRPRLDREGNGNWTVDLRDLAEAGRLPIPTAGSTLMLVNEATDAYDLDGRHVTRGELFRLNVVTDDQLLSLLERQELGLRARLEQTIAETTTLRDTLDRLKREIEALGEAQDEDADDVSSGNVLPGDGDREESDAAEASEQDRSRQVVRLRVQQAGLQATKTHEELGGMVAALESLFEEMVNNRVDTVDRQKRLRDDVRAPLVVVIEEPLATLRGQIGEMEQDWQSSRQAAETAAEAVKSAEKTILGLTAVLEKMLDLESYNEILDLFRGLIEDQDSLLEDTKSEQKKKVLDLFQ